MEDLKDTIIKMVIGIWKFQLMNILRNFSEYLNIKLCGGGNYFALPANKCFIIWDKLQPVGISFAMAEYAWTSFDKVAKICKQRTQGQEQRFHPTQKPIYLYDFVLKHFANPNDLILDTHLGSGSSRIAAYKGGFNFVGFEIDKEYYEKQEKRFKDFVSQLRMF